MERREHVLTKFNNNLRPEPVSELILPTFIQELYFSPNNVYVYVFFYQDQVMVINSETFVVENVLHNKSWLNPLGYDMDGRFWLQRDSSTAEAWDATLENPRSRHRLKGYTKGCYVNEQGFMSVITYSDKDMMLREYELK